MKVLLAIYSRNEEILQIGQTLRDMGFEVVVWYADSFFEAASYLNRKLCKWGYRRILNKYNNERKAGFYKIVKEFGPDMVLFINMPSSIFEADDLNNEDMRYAVVWFVDGLIKDAGVVGDYCKHMNAIYVFEPSDVGRLNAHGIKNAEYMPVGYNDVYAANGCGDSKVYDIAFVGSPYKKRLVYMNAIAKYALENNLTCFFAGPMYSVRHPWKEYIMRMKYPYLMKVVRNRTLSPKELADVYRKSKICINIHSETNKGLNPRVFEIMATGSFQLMDERQDYCSLVHPGEDCDVFASVSEAIAKIELYLRHEEMRSQMGDLGRIYTNRLSMKNALKHMMEKENE